MKILFYLFLFSLTNILFAQDYTAYHDITNAFSVFEKGNKRVLEYTTIHNYKVGGKGVVYVNNQGILKVYQEGRVYNTRLTNPSAYHAMDDLILFNVGQQLMTFDKGQYNLLTSWASHYKVGDSLVIYFDQLENSFNAYYQNKKIVLEENVPGEITHYWVGDNTAAYVDNNESFKVFYNGTVNEILFNTTVRGVKVAKNTICYINENLETFEVVYKGKHQVLEDFVPLAYYIGDDYVAYYSNNNEFKVFYKGEMKTLGLFEPKKVKAIDDVLTFEQDNLFKVFYKGKTTTLESFIPSSVVVDYQTVVYIDAYGNLKGFVDGVSISNIAHNVKTFGVKYNNIRFDLGNNNSKIYYKGTVY